MPYDLDTVRKTALLHGVDGEPTLMPRSGMVNEVWQIGDNAVLRIIDEDDCDQEAGRESLIVPLLVEAGVRTPRLIAADLSCSLVPRPYTPYEKAEGVLLGSLEADPAEFPELYRQLGREIAAINRVRPPDVFLSKLSGQSAMDARSQLKKTLDAGVISADDGNRVASVIARLEAGFGEPGPSVLVHRDIHPWNVFVNPQSHELTAIIDWGDASWGDAAIEFASMPFEAIPLMFKGYREAGGRVDPSLVVRSLYRGLGLALWEASHLDPDLYLRHWWRLSPDGWDATLSRIEAILAQAHGL